MGNGTIPDRGKTIAPSELSQWWTNGDKDNMTRNKKKKHIVFFQISAEAISAFCKFWPLWMDRTACRRQFSSTLWGSAFQLSSSSLKTKSFSHLAAKGPLISSFWPYKLWPIQFSSENSQSIVSVFSYIMGLDCIFFLLWLSFQCPFPPIQHVSWNHHQYLVKHQSI